MQKFEKALCFTRNSHTKNYTVEWSSAIGSSIKKKIGVITTMNNFVHYTIIILPRIAPSYVYALHSNLCDHKSKLTLPIEHV